MATKEQFQTNPLLNNMPELLDFLSREPDVEQNLIKTCSQMSVEEVFQSFYRCHTDDSLYVKARAYLGLKIPKEAMRELTAHCQVRALLQIQDINLRNALLHAFSRNGVIPSNEELQQFQSSFTTAIANQRSFNADDLGILVHRIWDRVPDSYYQYGNPGAAVGNTALARFICLNQIKVPAIREAMLVYALSTPAFTVTAQQVAAFNTRFLAGGILTTAAHIDTMIQTIWPVGGGNPPANYFQTQSPHSVEIILNDHNRLIPILSLPIPLRDALLDWALSPEGAMFAPTALELQTLNTKVIETVKYFYQDRYQYEFLRKYDYSGYYNINQIIPILFAKALDSLIQQSGMAHLPPAGYFVPSTRGMRYHHESEGLLKETKTNLMFLPIINQTGKGFAAGIAFGESYSQNIVSICNLEDATLRDALLYWATREKRFAPTEAQLAAISAAVAADISQHGPLTTLRFDQIIQNSGIANLPPSGYFNTGGEGERIGSIMVATNQRLAPIYTMNNISIRNALLWHSTNNKGQNFFPQPQQIVNLSTYLLDEKARHGIITKARFGILVHSVFPGISAHYFSGNEPGQTQGYNVELLNGGREAYFLCQDFIDSDYIKNGMPKFYALIASSPQLFEEMHILLARERVAGRTTVQQIFKSFNVPDSEIANRLRTVFGEHITNAPGVIEEFRAEGLRQRLLECLDVRYTQLHEDLKNFGLTDPQLQKGLSDFVKIGMTEVEQVVSKLQSINKAATSHVSAPNKF